MNTAAGFLGYLLGAIAMGMTCGTGCSPAISLFLGSYVFQAEGEMKQSLGAFFRFFAGKSAAVLLVCLISSFAGSALVSIDGYFGRYQLKYLMPAFLILTGLYMLRKCLKEHQHAGCSGCGGQCGHARADKFQNASPMVGGFLYGITPCAPLILLAGYAVTLPVLESLALGVVFSISCMTAPLLFMLMLTKLLVIRMKKEVPSFFRGTKVVISALVLVMGIVTCFTGIEGSLI